VPIRGKLFPAPSPLTLPGNLLTSSKPKPASLTRSAAYSVKNCDNPPDYPRGFSTVVGDPQAAPMATPVADLYAARLQQLQQQDQESQQQTAATLHRLRCLIATVEEIDLDNLPF
jgi:hypothetical protein